MEEVKPNFEEEQKHLDKTITILDNVIGELKDRCEKGVSDVQSLSKYHWENKSEMDYMEFASSRGDINFQASLVNDDIHNLRSYMAARKKPLFGRIKGYFDGELDDFYIGVRSIMDDSDMYVIDWRCGAASLFYNMKKDDKGTYDTPDGKKECSLLMRKQIDIKNDKITRIVDSDIYLSDDMLQEVLSKSSDGRMKSIVSTIQEEQNDIIRNLKDKKIVVQGSAGSGKTCVALHRLSYLLYNDKKSNSENMLIFSPSDAFSSYIESVLPELGEDNILQTTFADFANSFVTYFDKIEKYSDFVAKYYDGINSQEKNEINKFKFSKEYKDALDKYIKRVANSYRFKNDFSFKNLTIPAGYMNKVLDSEEKLSLQDKIEAVYEETLRFYDKRENINRNLLRKSIASELIKPAFNAKKLYDKFLESQEFAEAFGKKGNKLGKALLEYPDLIGLLYLNFELMGYPDNSIIHHLVIDEAQDYAPLQMEMISKMFRGATITALGDSNQTINPYHKYDSLEDLKNIMTGAKYIELNKAYRSSPEIIDYTNKIINDDKTIAVRKSSGIPVVVKEIDKSDLFTTLVKDILTMKENGFERICVITKSSKEAKAIYEGLKDSIPGLEVLTDEEEFGKRAFVSPSYLAKGLEFDAVINYNDVDNPYNEEDKYLYYVACTRAQHNLMVYNEPKILGKRL